MTLIRFNKAFFVLSLFILLAASALQAQPGDSEEFDYVRHVFLSSKGFQPRNGMVPDIKTAEAIARAVALPIYGENQVSSELPFRSQLKDGSWIVLGTLNCKNCSGGTIMVQIDQRSGKILYISHSL